MIDKLICAGSADAPFACGEEAVTIISGFSQCQKHANEAAMRWRMLNKMQKQKATSPYESKSIYSNDIPGQSLKGLGDLKSGVFKNVKHKY